MNKPYLRLLIGLMGFTLAGCRWLGPSPTPITPTWVVSVPSPAATATPTPSPQPLTPSPSQTIPLASPTVTTPAATGAATTTTPTPTHTPSPPHPLTPTPQPLIHFFQANVAIADPGDTLELSWATSNATRVTLYRLMPSGQLGTFWDVAPNGTFVYTTAPTDRNHVDFALFAGNASGAWVQATVTVPLTCPDTWFFAPAPNECPWAAPLYSAGAEQSFERGFMVWVEAQDQIYVLFSDGQSPGWKVLYDNWDEGDPVDDPTLIPPAGLYQPVRGFGLIWREEAGVRDRLGWATAPEAGFTTIYQSTARPKYNEFYLLALDSAIWHLFPELSRWEKIE